jgi:fatty-acyl-CoA synthase
LTELRRWVRAVEASKKAAHLVLPELIDQLAETHGESLALIGECDALSYRSLAARVNRYARWALEKRVAGHTVALLMHNCPDYAAIWLGLTRVGCTVALLNINLRQDGLTHCINVSGAKYLLASNEFSNVVDRLGARISVLSLPTDAVDDDSYALTAPLPAPQNVALLVYTSGTTGLPKAAKITHRRITEWSFWFAGMTDATASDRLYNCLPMYHSVGGIVAIGSMLVVGGSVVIRRRFSASRFWHDVAQTGCTIFQYIGELCRYLSLTPPSPIERHHRLRLAVGNGLQADVWRTMKGRFAVPHILEYYAATEGVLSLYNWDGLPGAIGRIPPLLEPYVGITLIRVNFETGEPLRAPDGLCIPSAVNEPGEAIGPIKDGRRFDGYHDPEATDRKILRNVLREGDQWYRSGDLMRRDTAGFYFFVDRLGDTFRWKGENVSTTEVADVVRTCPGVLDAIVYGVQVPAHEGRAGMAAITTREGFTLEQLVAHLHEHLPPYARPVFVRLCESLDTTGTFKLAKGRFAAEGYLHATDRVYVYCNGSFVLRPPVSCCLKC